MPFREQELMLAQDLGQLAIWEWHVASDELRWLPGAVPLFGRPMDEVRTRARIIALVHGEDRERVNATVLHALHNFGEFQVEYRVTWPSGEVHWIHSRGRVVQTPDRGEVVIGVAQDITARKNKETSLQTQARLLELAYEPILVRDADDNITYWNRGAERLYGYSWREAKGQLSHALLRTRFPEPLQDIQSHLDETGFWEGELVHYTKENRLIHVASRWQRLKDGGQSTLETNFDLSQQKALQIARSWEEKARLIGELSHEINNPLAAATSAAYLLRNGCDREPVRQYLAILEESISRIADFIRRSNELHQTARMTEREIQQGQVQ